VKTIEILLQGEAIPDIQVVVIEADSAVPSFGRGRRALLLVPRSWNRYPTVRALVLR